MNAYELTSTPALVDLGKTGRATVRASVPFIVGAALHCADYLHPVDAGRSKCAVFRASEGAPAGVLKVWPSR
jgi:hypothetical protein